MKKTFFYKYIIATFLCAVISNSAFAEQKFYAGLDLTGQSLSLKKQSDPDLRIQDIDSFYDTTSGGASIFAGIDFTDKNFKLESFFTVLEGNSKTSSTVYQGDDIENKSKINTQIFGVDIKPYKKFTEKTSGYLIAGLNYVKIDIKEVAYFPADNETYRKSQHVHKIAPSAGIGIEHVILPNLSLRGQVKYVYLNAAVNEDKSGAINKIKYSVLTNIGLSYNF